MDWGLRPTRVQILAPLLTSCVTLGKIFSLSDSVRSSERVGKPIIIPISQSKRIKADKVCETSDKSPDTQLKKSQFSSSHSFQPSAPPGPYRN